MTQQPILSEFQISLTPADEWQGDLTIELVPGGQPGPGQPGKEAGDLLLVETQAGRRLLISLGEAEKIDSERVRRAGGAAAKWLAKYQPAGPAFRPEPAGRLSAADVAQAFTEGLLLRSFRFADLKSGDGIAQPLTVHILAAADPAVEQAVRKAQLVTEGVNLARRIAHEPPNLINPVTLAQRARDLGQELGLKVTVLDETALQQLGAGAILAVGQGSRAPSRLIVIEYPGKNPPAGARPVVVIGKAITFDTGGYSLKDRNGMVGMKYDKCGGADVLGLLHAAARLELPIPLVGIIAAAENMVSDLAYRPNDIITSLSGKTIEIISTDAEGRLVLADALTYAHRNYQPRAIIDIATLTGGVVVALGQVRAGLLSNNEDLAQALAQSGERVHERLWRLPLDDDYFELIKGDDSDLKNSSAQRGAHPIVGGIFLKQFVPDEVPWAHLDVAGTAFIDRDLPYSGKGATGFGVRLILDYLETLAG